ncbi:enoyl-CoA hydratase/isomerase family protein [Microbacterium lacus]|uniref:enoyl-CoA hydratase-related protein n=1 Tax=Microbacterium lacus TaxID=415217 RepID=UPI00384BC5A4
MPSPLEIEVVDRCLVMTLNRPERRNAVNAELGQLILEASERLDSDPMLRVGVLQANGSTFCAGMDLKEFSTLGPPRGLFRFVRRQARKPLIAAVQGPAYAGGLEIVLTCDVVVASRSASFGLPEVGRGLIAGAGGLYRLPRKVGEGLANLMVLTGEPIGAQQAQDAGLVSALVDEADLRDRALEIAHRMAENSPIAVRSSKRLLEHAQGNTFSEYWDLQRSFMTEIGAAPDAYEGTAAFVERRQPQWQTD